MRTTPMNLDTAEAPDSALVDTAHDVEAMTEGIPSPRVRPRYGWYPPVKTVAEYLIAIGLFLVCLPFIILAALAIKITSPGPIFYLQTRQGRRGRNYRIIKLRTMVQDAEAKTGAVWSQKNDPRVTRIGSFLRATHIDEFPQLINVLRGEMALIGPRPERPEIAENLVWHITEYPQRLEVRPGITGLAQLRLPPDSDLQGVREKVIHDLYYIHRMSPWLDVRITVKTGWLLFKTCLKSVFSFARLPKSDRVRDDFSSHILVGSKLARAAEEVDSPAVRTSHSA